MFPFFNGKRLQSVCPRVQRCAEWFWRKQNNFDSVSFLANGGKTTSPLIYGKYAAISPAKDTIPFTLN